LRRWHLWFLALSNALLSTPKTGIAFPKTGVVFLQCRLYALTCRCACEIHYSRSVRDEPHMGRGGASVGGIRLCWPFLLSPLFLNPKKVGSGNVAECGYRIGPINRRSSQVQQVVPFTSQAVNLSNDIEKQACLSIRRLSKSPMDFRNKHSKPLSNTFVSLARTPYLSAFPIIKMINLIKKIPTEMISDA